MNEDELKEHLENLEDGYKELEFRYNKAVLEIIEDLDFLLVNLAKDRTTLNMMEIYIEVKKEKWEERKK